MKRSLFYSIRDGNWKSTDELEELISRFYKSISTSNDLEIDVVHVEKVIALYKSNSISLDMLQIWANFLENEAVYDESDIGDRVFTVMSFLSDFDIAEIKSDHTTKSIVDECERILNLTNSENS